MAREELKPVFDFCEQNGFKIYANDPAQFTFVIKKKVGVDFEHGSQSVLLSNINFTFKISQKINLDVKVAGKFLAKILEEYINNTKDKSYKKIL